MLWSDQAGGVPSIRARIAVVMLVVAWFLLMVVVILVIVLGCA